MVIVRDATPHLPAVGVFPYRRRLATVFRCAMLGAWLFNNVGPSATARRWFYGKGKHVQSPRSVSGQQGLGPERGPGFLPHADRRARAAPIARRAYGPDPQRLCLEGAG